MAGSHAILDSYGFVLPALLPLLIPNLGLTLVMAGLLVTVHQVASSFAQPFLGHLADRGGGFRWMSWGGLLATGVAAGALGFVQNFASLAGAMLVMGIGVALFHPASATLVSQTAPPGSRGLWMSLYVSLGNLGLGLGPLAVGILLERFGLGSIWLLALPAIAAAFLIWSLGPSLPLRGPRVQRSLIGIVRGNERLLLLLTGVVAARAWASNAFQVFLPLFVVSRGASVGDGARLLSLYLGAGALGGIVGGVLADRLGRDRVIIGSLLLSVPFGLLLVAQQTPGPLFWVAAGLNGFLLQGSFVVLTLRGQESIPGSVGMMSGMMLGFTIGIGGLAVTPMGYLAELVGLEPVLIGAALLAVVSAGLMLLVPAPPRPTPASA